MAIIADEIVYAALLKVRSAMRMRWNGDQPRRATPAEARLEHMAVFVNVRKGVYLALVRRGVVEFVIGLGAALRLTELGRAEIMLLESDDETVDDFTRLARERGYHAV